MQFASKGSLISIFALCLTLSAVAQNASPRDQPTPNAGTLTGKERLGRKWMDEQRIDNCNVPIDKRGTRPRSATCSHVPTG
jgi:hypothetical protein